MTVSAQAMLMAVSLIVAAPVLGGEALGALDRGTPT
jgi:hypothetical protein